jgi:hypothetical protein
LVYSLSQTLPSAREGLHRLGLWRNKLFSTTIRENHLNLFAVLDIDKLAGCAPNEFLSSARNLLTASRKEKKKNSYPDLIKRKYSTFFGSV